jgi:hypothetical protein
MRAGGEGAAVLIVAMILYVAAIVAFAHAVTREKPGPKRET